MNQHSHFAIEQSEVVSSKAKDSHSDWRLLRRLKLPQVLNDPGSEPTVRAIYLDVEATGLRVGVDEVIELAMLPFDYERESGKVTAIHHREALNALREPSIEISPEATAVNGISNEDVKGQAIDAAAVDELVKSASLIIAHNASFDRPMVESIWPVFKKVAWACSFKDVNWRGQGFSGSSLEYLGMKFGWFFDGHRALADCEAGVALLAETLPVSDTRVLAELRHNAMTDTYRIPAKGAPFEKKDELKERGYRWNAEKKVWWTEVRELDEELTWLSENIYGKSVKLPAKKISANIRYSDRNA